MKFSIKQDVLCDLILKGGISSLVESNPPVNNIGFLSQCIKITLDDNLSIESSTPVMSSKFSIPASVNNSITVAEKGICVILAKEFFQWIKIQGTDSNISIEVKTLKHPEFLETSSDLEKDKNKIQKITVKKISSVEFVAKDSAKTGSKWNLDGYDYEQFPAISYDKIGEKLFDVTSNALQIGYDKVVFSCCHDDYKHILDNILVQSFNNDVYFSATDSHRCAIYRMDMITNAKLDSKILIPYIVIKTLLPILEKNSKLSFYANKESKKMYIVKDCLIIRINNFEDDIVDKFPNVVDLMKYQYSKLSCVSKSGLKKALSVAGVVNKEAALFAFNKENSSLIIKTVAMDGKFKPCVTKIDIMELVENYKAVWGVKHLIDVIKVLESDTVQLSLPSNNVSVRVTGENDKDFFYFALNIKNKKYLEEL